MESKKGYFFVLDAIIGLFVISLGLIMIFSFFKYEPTQSQVDYIAFDAMEFLSSNKISDLNNEYIGPQGVLHKDGNITRLENSMLEQIAEFYYRNETYGTAFTIPLINSFILNITENNLPQSYGLIVKIENITVHNNTGLMTLPMEDAEVITPSKAIVYGIYNETELFGPYSVEVIVWK